MNVSGIAVDQATQMPFVVLHDLEKKVMLPIWIGVFEASAIATHLEGIKLTRPMTHDLLKSVLDSLDGTLVRVEIVDLKESTFFAVLLVKRNVGDDVRIDARPSDAIALAIRTGKPVFVEEAVIEKAKDQKQPSPQTKAEMKSPEELKDLLQQLSDEAFGKYKM